GEEGAYRIVRGTATAPAEVDGAWDQKLADAKISQASYRAAMTSEAIRQALEDKLVTADSASGLQRRVAELYIAQAPATLGEKAIKVRHILYSPKGDPSNASKVPETDPSWAEAQQKAQKAYETLQKNPTQFDAIARKERDETPAGRDDRAGRKLASLDQN